MKLRSRARRSGRPAPRRSEPCHSLQDIARSLARAGSAIVLNGLGRADESERMRASVAAEFAVKVSYSPADMTDPKVTGWHQGVRRRNADRQPSNATVGGRSFSMRQAVIRCPYSKQTFLRIRLRDQLEAPLCALTESGRRSH